MRSRMGGVAAVLACAVFVVGCGEDDSSSLTKAEFTEQADAICDTGQKEKNAAIIAVVNQNNLPKPAMERQVIAAALPPLREMVEELSELGLPASGEGQARVIVDEVAAAVQNLENDPRSVLKGLKNPFAKVEELSGKYGLESCALL